MGGHSLKATTFISKAFKELNVEIPLRQIFETPTIIELAKFLRTTDESIYSAIKPIEEREYYPLSSAQKRLSILHQFNASSTSYNIPGAMIIEGKLDPVSLESAFKELIKRHESLRTSFEMVNGKTVQRINQKFDFEIVYKVKSQDKDIEEMVKDFVRPFDISNAPLLRVELVELSKEKIPLSL